MVRRRAARRYHCRCFGSRNSRARRDRSAAQVGRGSRRGIGRPQGTRDLCLAQGVTQCAQAGDHVVLGRHRYRRISMADPGPWPSLPLKDWLPTCDTLHMLTQMVGKTRLGLTVKRNHWWNAALYVSARGLTSSVMPLPDGDLLEIEFD